MTLNALPKTQFAIQLVGPNQLVVNNHKEVVPPGPHQVVAQIEAVGLCFSDLKLLKQFATHPRKTDVLRGLSPAVLSEISSYVPNGLPTVPGHEVVCRIVAAGDKVTRYKVGERCVVQTDYRQLPTAASNSSFGYNFEGALQEYVLMDERVIIEPTSNERFLIPAGEELCASSAALIEPWACVENSYTTRERNTLKAVGKLLVVADAGRELTGLKELLANHTPAEAAFCGCGDCASIAAALSPRLRISASARLSDLPHEGFDDIIYFGHDKATIEVLNDKLIAGGIINIVLGGEKIGRPVLIGVGRIHYGGTRWIGTVGQNAADSYRMVPPDGELREGDKVLVVGAGGPMGQMHIIRALCLERTVGALVGTVRSATRLDTVRRKAEKLARERGINFHLVDVQHPAAREKFTYISLMAPVPEMVADAVLRCGDDCIVNIFAGIAAPIKHELDLDAIIAKRAFLFGTSGSLIKDMKIVLKRVQSGRLDTNWFVDAISGLAGAADGMAAVEKRTLAGKIVVYPALPDVGLIPLSELARHYPTVAAKLTDGMWCKEAEKELLRVAAKSLLSA